MGLSNVNAAGLGGEGAFFPAKRGKWTIAKIQKPQADPKEQKRVKTTHGVSL
ncbi:MAG TPA: hypothetical protein VJS13_11665 [Pyrinomonadaceae bacterium]|nr:hypothetical protein [Pyrinomonadaceae bacterium]